MTGMTGKAGMAEVVIDWDSLRPAQVEAVARGGARVAIGAEAIERMRAARDVIEQHLGDGRAHYGINTGFGSLSMRRIGANDVRALQRNLVRSHSAGIGAPLGRDVVRAMMFLLAGSLARGRSGVRPVVAERLVQMLNADVTPVVPELGSVGASGDLAPLAHVALALIGEGEAIGEDGVRCGGGEVLRAAGLEPLVLEAKEGLALINGTHLMAARGALLVCDFDRLFEASLLAAAMSIDASRGTDSFLDPRVYEARNQPGPAWAARRLRSLLEGSQIVPSHKDGDPRVQDPYSLRCAAIVMGACWDAAGYVKRAIEAELGAVTDNPLVFVGDGMQQTAGEVGGDAGGEHRHRKADVGGKVGGTGEIVSAGNFHGMPVAIPLDVLCISLSHIAGISERRTFSILAATDPHNPVPAYLSPEPGVHSGLMIAQYTAAACCNEIIGLSAPASVANLSTSAGIEDYNSFGPRSAAKAARALELARNVVAIELLCAAEGLEYQRPLRSGAGVERGHEIIRSVVSRLREDRPPSPDIAAIAGLIERGAFPAE